MRSGAPTLTRASSWWRGRTAPLLVLAAAKLAIHLATNGTYGFHRDELYYIASGLHPALGYVDYPPVTPMLARLDTAVLGTSPWALRLLPALAGALVVLLSGLCAREMGGGRTAQVLASLVALTCPLLLGANWLFQTVTFDQLTWVVAMYLVLRLLRTDSPRLWMLLGADLGIGLETKLTILALCAGLVIGLVASGQVRARLRTPWPWVAIGLALLLALPNLSWQLANGLPTLTYVTNHEGDIAQGGGVVAFVATFLLFVGPVVLPLWGAGWFVLFRDTRLRPLGIAALVALLVLLPEGKAYYPGPIIPVVLAAGCVGVERVASDRRRRRLVAAIAVASVVETTLLAPVGIPLVPQASLHATHLDAARQDFADTVGWPELAAQVGAAYRALPVALRQRTAILAENYGEAGALGVGGSRSLPTALSGELSFWYWKAAHVGATSLLTVGFDSPALSFLCASITRLGAVVIPDSVDNQEQGAPILLCTHLTESLDAAWPALRRFQ